MLILAIVIALVVLVIIARMQVRCGVDPAHPAWMSEQWLDAYRRLAPASHS